MKFLKISLIAALALGTSAYALDNIKFEGDTKLFYGTQTQEWNNFNKDANLFQKESSYADAALRLNFTGDLAENVSMGVTALAITTLGTDEIADGRWSGSHSTTDDNIEAWISDLWISGTYGKTTGTLGRIELQTPLIFTETWSLDTNTFEAGMITNQDIPSTTLTAAFIGKSNGYADDTSGANVANLTAVGGKFDTFGSNGAVVLGAVNNSFEPLTAQAWYYNMPSDGSAYWLQADLEMGGLSAGLQYTDIGYEATGSKNDTAYAAKLGYTVKDIVSLTAAYSAVSDTGTNGVVNMATSGQTSGAASSLYTEMWWWFGTVSSVGATSMSLSAEASVSDVDLFLGLYSSDNSVSKDSVQEVALTASKSFGSLDTSVALLYDMFDQDAVKPVTYVDSMSTIQLYFTYNF